MTTIQESEILDLIREGRRWIDVRAPVEFAAGSIPGAINIPILDDEERRLVGTCYKVEGREKAVALGHQIVSGENKERKIQAWLSAIENHPDIAVYCFRGGMRSQISQSWIKESGKSVPRVLGGYKKIRTLLMACFANRVAAVDIQLISGPTGSLKTHVIQWLQRNNFLSIDLENHAAHRGSAFGRQGAQPSQVDFEHAIGKGLLIGNYEARQNKILYLEDESRLIGKCIIPDLLFTKMRSSPILWIDEPIDVRVENIFNDYVLLTDIVNSVDVGKVSAVYGKYINALTEIKKRLGLEKYAEILKDISLAQEESIKHSRHDLNRVWIRKLLQSYYDPLYLHSLERRSPRTLLKASAENIKLFITQ